MTAYEGIPLYSGFYPRQIISYKILLVREAGRVGHEEEYVISRIPYDYYHF